MTAIGTDSSLFFNSFLMLIFGMQESSGGFAGHGSRPSNWTNETGVCVQVYHGGERRREDVRACCPKVATRPAGYPARTDTTGQRYVAAFARL